MESLPSARVRKVLLREATKADLDPSAQDPGHPTFERHGVTSKTAVPVDALGLEGSVAFNRSKRFELNGGRVATERAVLLQSSGNVKALLKAGLKLERPLSEADLQPGNFGENLFVEPVDAGEDTGFSAERLCVGDEIECWRGAEKGPLRFQVASPRCPCGKVDEKLGKTFTLSGVRAHCAKSGLAGCFMRTLRDGDIQDGDLLKVVARPYPQWTLSRVSHLLYGHDQAVMQYLLRGRKAVKDRTTSVILREEFMGSQEELEELAALPPLAVFEWKEHAVKMLGAAPIGRYAALSSWNSWRWAAITAVSMAAITAFLLRKNVTSK